MPSSPKPIETHYKGYRFRSRLEARWAVFFDALGVKWEYEPETLRAGSRAYLPDFLLESRLLVEVKPLHLAVTGAVLPEEQQRWSDASLSAAATLLVVFGPPDPRGNPTALTGDFTLGAGAWLVDVEIGCCRNCGGFGWWHEDVGYELLCIPECDKDRAPLRTPFYEAAAETSRAARFEWGESGVPSFPVRPKPLTRDDPLYDDKKRIQVIDAELPFADNDRLEVLMREKVELFARIRAGDPRWKKA